MVRAEALFNLPSTHFTTALWVCGTRNSVTRFATIYYFYLFFRLKQLIGRLREDATAVDPDMLISNLEYVAEVVSSMAARNE